MAHRTIHTDYLIIGAGAMGLAFADVVLDEDPDARIVIVDRRDSPGGHWNDAYPFVRLHQPSAFYGLHSTRLGEGGAERASGPEVVAYFKRAMDRFVATGRVRFLSMSDHRGDGRVVSILDEDDTTDVVARRRVVDATYMTTEVPSRRPRAYAVDPGVALVPPNSLTRLTRSWNRYVIVGAGKTGIDAVLFLLDQGVPPRRIQWIVSQDSWLLNRAGMRPDLVLDTFTRMVESVAGATDVDDVFLHLERLGIVFRIDRHGLPTKWRCATVDEQELEALRRVEDVVRLGRVVRIGTTEIQLDAGAIEVAEDSLVVDCSADGLARLDARPLFSDRHVVVQPVVMCQQTFSAALIARLELLDMSDEKRNRLCAPAPHPERTVDLAPVLVTSTRNMMRLLPHMPWWLRRSRLSFGYHAGRIDYVRGLARLALRYRSAVASTDRVLNAGAPTRPGAGHGDLRASPWPAGVRDRRADGGTGGPTGAGRRGRGPTRPESSPGWSSRIPSG